MQITLRWKPQRENAKHLFLKQTACHVDWEPKRLSHVLLSCYSLIILLCSCIASCSVFKKLDWIHVIIEILHWTVLPPPPYNWSLIVSWTHWCTFRSVRTVQSFWHPWVVFDYVFLACVFVQIKIYSKAITFCFSFSLLKRSQSVPHCLKYLLNYISDLPQSYCHSITAVNSISCDPACYQK